MKQELLISLADKDELLTLVYAVRKRVFIEEQQIPAAEEYDEFESASRHFLIQDTVSGEGAGAARWRTTAKGIKLERFCVLPGYRYRGLGTRLIQAVMTDIREQLNGDQLLYLHAQQAAVSLYARQGFVAEGDVFLECGIPHRFMSKSISCR